MSGDKELAQLLKEATGKVHREAESTQFMKAFIRGQLGKNEHIAYIVAMYHIYIVMEKIYADACTSSADAEKLKSLYFPKELDRTQSLEEDLEFFLGKNWRKNKDIVDMSPATREYVERIREVGTRDPLLLIAHAYTRYLGDLSGGLLLGGMAKKTLKLDDKGLAFFEFSEIPDPEAFKNEYRARMNALGLSEDRANEMAEEAVVSFELNIKLFSELDKRFGLVPGSESDKTLTQATLMDSPLEEQANKADTGGCCVVM